MTSREELEKMTVAQIKERLKSRKVPTSGTKADLIGRLHESLMAEEKLLEEDSGPGGDNIDLSNVNVDEVLGLDDDKDTSSASDAKPNDSLLSLGSPINDSVDKSHSKDETNKQEAPVIKKHAEITGPAKTGTDVEQDQSEQPSDGGKIEPDKKSALATETAEEKKVQLKMAARLGVPLAESEQKAKRAARFGNGTAATETETTNVDEKELKAKRAARFGISVDANIEEAKRKPASEEDEKMLKRAERFGLPLKRGAAASDASSNNSSSVIGEDVLQKRAKRFGTALECSGNDDSKKVARAKRFGQT